MKPHQLRKLDADLTHFVDELIAGMGRPERLTSMRTYIEGLLLDGERKSITPMAARLVDDASEIQGMRQRLQECVTTSVWSSEEMFGRAAMMLERELPGIEALVFDDTGFPKKGIHSP